MTIKGIIFDLDGTLTCGIFFVTCSRVGKTATNLAVGIPSVAQRYGARLPRRLTPEQVDVLVKAVRTESPGGQT